LDPYNRKNIDSDAEQGSPGVLYRAITPNDRLRTIKLPYYQHCFRPMNKTHEGSANLIFSLDGPGALNLNIRSERWRLQ